MRSLAHVCVLVLVTCPSPATPQQSQPSLGGSWKATFADSLVSGSLEISLDAQPNGTVSGTYKASTGGAGTITGTLQGQTLKFILTQTVEGCPGSYTGTLSLENDQGSGTYWGNDCQGRHENGVISMARAAPGNVTSHGVETPGQRSHVCAWIQDTLEVFHEVGSSEVIDHLGPHEEFTVAGRIGTTDTNKLGTWVKVVSNRNIVGYAKAGAVCEGPAPRTQNVTSPVLTPSVQTPAAYVDSDYPLRLKVLQTEQIPYTVQVGGGQINTNCSIGGTVNTQGSATTMGNFTDWSAYTYPNLQMSCSSYETPPMGWRHVLSAMLVVASDGNAYIIACDAAWRWSKCRGLRPGDSFEARWAKGGISVVYYTDKRKPKEATYAVLVSRSLK